MLPPSAPASYMRCLLFDDPASQLERDGLSVPQLPYLAAGIPPPTCLFHSVPQLHFVKADAHGHPGVIGEGPCRRVPITLCDDQLHGLEPLFLLRIVAIPHADQTVPVLREQLLGAFLAWLEVQPRPHGTELHTAPGAFAGGEPGADRAARSCGVQQASTLAKGNHPGGLLLV